MSTIPAAIILGIICGLLGALFVWVNTNLSKKRKVIITKKWQKLLEVALFSLATSSAFYWMPYFFNECKANSDISDANQDLLVRYDCDEG